MKVSQLDNLISERNKDQYKETKFTKTQHYLNGAMHIYGILLIQLYTDLVKFSRLAYEEQKLLS